MAVRLGDDRQVCLRLLQPLASARRAIIGVYFPPIPWPMTEVEVKKVTLSHAEAVDLDVHFSAVHNQAADDAFDEAIREADAALEDLI